MEASLRRCRFLFNDFVGPKQNSLRNCEAKLSRRFKIHCQLQPIERLDRQTFRAASRENPLDVFCRQATDFVVTHAIAHESSLRDETGVLKHCRQFLCPRCGNDELGLTRNHRVSSVEICVSLLGLESLEIQLECFCRRDVSLNKLDL